MGKHILMFGRDERLLSTRRLVLESSGYTVEAQLAPAAIELSQARDRIDILILCHSLSAEQCFSAEAQARFLWPDVQTLTLTAGQSGCAELVHSRTLDSRDGPAKLVSVVRQMAAQRVEIHQQ